MTAAAIPAPPAHRRVNRAAGYAAGGAAAATLLVTRVPAVGQVVPPCPFHAATGLDCPGCGMTRAVGALTRLDVAAAIGHNAFAMLVVLPLVAAIWWRWLRHRPLPAPVASAAFVPVLVAVAAVFAVARNLPIAPFSALAA